MSSRSVSRRDFVRSTGALAGGSALRLTAPLVAAAAQAACTARDEDAAFTTLTSAEALTLEAVAARILPTTTTPGAREAGVIYFMDNVLGDQLAYLLPDIRGLLEPFDAGAAERFSPAERFSDLSEADQDAWLTEQQQTPFFFLVRALTLMGFFAMSSYGGNRDNVGWKLIGFEGHVASQPPFGYYDAEYMEREADGN